MSERPLLLDTCAVIWMADGQLGGDAAREIVAAGGRGEAHVSPITAWEIGLLVSRGRMALNRPTEAWFDALFQGSPLNLAPMPPLVLIQSSSLPGEPPRDPADRIIAASARAFGWRVMTRDRALIDYARAGHVEVVAC